MQLKFLTWNIRGVGSQTKKNKVLNYLKNTQANTGNTPVAIYTKQLKNYTF